ncbi:hypothetical protein GCM10010252_78190 [Streptomyces aureoverticillatus]|nr:hypothetical protein GCM10010252_78190 [Streptomyces aureoverticillatus]
MVFVFFLVYLLFYMVQEETRGIQDGSSLTPVDVTDMQLG